MTTFRVFLVTASIITAMIVAMFIYGLGNRTLNSSTVDSWFLVLAVPVMTIAGGLSLQKKGRTGLAIVVMVLAVPVALVALLAVYMMAWNGRWN
ncbi:hypothetical protein ACQW02_08990 [Humitalea sp. 24SJ18S-53]|uniref:hypothetical protein n=1 Tax=Humitalea sp. 24SJ18S-53 TaxID=3422307 RepID=UPI003D668997